MSEQQHIQRQGVRTEDEAVLETVRVTTSTAGQGIDDLLDEIDGLLESDASEYVRSFVQKGGQ